MNSRFYIPALITLGLGILSGCGGSSSSEQAYLPIGLQRTLDITLPDGRPYVFSFIIASESTASIYTGTSPAARLNGIHSCRQLQAFLRLCGTNRLLLVVQ